MKIGISRIKVAHVFTVLFLLCLESGCSCAQDNKEKTTGTKAKKEFTLPDIPQVLTTSEDRAEYLVLHYWDNFDFTDTVLISKPEITEQAFVDFLNILPYTQIENSRKALIGLMESASSDNLMLTHFMELTEKYLYDPNSPMRNEELYIPVLEYIIASFNVKTEDKIRPEYRLQMALKNRPGDLATDFKFADGTGKVRKLSDVKK